MAPHDAPHAGAWIETIVWRNNPDDDVSPPMRGRGLKQVSQRPRYQPRVVAPHAGAWIETLPGRVAEGF